MLAAQPPVARTAATERHLGAMLWCAMDLRDRLGIEHPIVQAGMAGGLATSALAAAVSRAGGLGTLGLLSPDALASEIEHARRLAPGRAARRGGRTSPGSGMWVSTLRSPAGAALLPSAAMTIRTLLAASSVAILSACAATAPPSIPPVATIPAYAGPPRPKVGSHAKPAEPPRPPETLDLAAVDAYVAKRLHAMNIPGASLVVVRDGKTVLAKGYGVASLETRAPVDGNTAFAVGSITKQFTCASLLLLEEQHKASLDDKVARYYPDLPRAKDITLGDLGAHVSGYPDYYPLDFSDSRMLRPIAADDLIHQYARAPLDFEPRTRWSYSNTGFVVLGRVVEKVSGKGFGAFLEDRIARPLGLAHTWFAPPDGKGTLAHGYTAFAGSAPEAAVREPEHWMFSAGAVYASAADLAAWELALVSGKVLRPASYKRMTTRRVLADGRTTDYGCGLGIQELRGETVLSHGGEVAGFLAYEAVVPRTRSVVVLLTNADYGETGALFKTVRDLVVKDGAPEAAPPKVSGPRPADVARALFEQMQAGVMDSIAARRGVRQVPDRRSPARGGAAARGARRSDERARGSVARARGHGGDAGPLRLRERDVDGQPGTLDRRQGPAVPPVQVASGADAPFAAPGFTVPDSHAKPLRAPPRLRALRALRVQAERVERHDACGLDGRGGHVRRPGAGHRYSLAQARRQSARLLPRGLRRQDSQARRSRGEGGRRRRVVPQSVHRWVNGRVPVAP